MGEVERLRERVAELEAAIRGVQVAYREDFPDSEAVCNAIEAFAPLMAPVQVLPLEEQG